MKYLDKFIALLLLAFTLGYGYVAWNYKLLPFEMHQPFRPNTMPLILSGLGLILSLLILFTPSKEDKDEFTADGMAANKPASSQKNYIQPIIFIGLMIGYAMLLRPIGFVIATISFLVIGGYILGERRYYILVPVAVIASVGIWYIVQQLLGIYLVPYPGLMADYFKGLGL